MKKEYCADLNDLFEIFEKNLSASDLIASRVLGKISATIVKTRLEMGMTQKEFAQYLEVSQSMVSKWESADYNFSVKALAEIASKLDFDLRIQFYKSEVVKMPKKMIKRKHMAEERPFYVINSNSDDNTQEKFSKFPKRYVENSDSLKMIIKEDTKCYTM